MLHQTFDAGLAVQSDLQPRFVRRSVLEGAAFRPFREVDPLCLL